MSFVDFFHLFLGIGIGLFAGFWAGLFIGLKGDELFWKS